LLDEDEIARQLDAVDAAEEANTALMAKTGELELSPGEMKFVFDEFDKRRMKRKHITDRMNAIVTEPVGAFPPGWATRVVKLKGNYYGVHNETYRLIPVHLQWTT
jgi:hypothetical protein